MSIRPCRLALIMLLLLCSWLPANVASAEKISVVYSQDSIPFHFTGPEGEPQGIMIDLWNLWSEKTGIEIDFIPAPWTETLEMMRTGRVEAHAGLFYNRERAKFMAYGPILGRTDTHVFYDKRLPAPETDEDLLPYRIGLIKNDTVETYLRNNLPGAKLAGFPDYEAMMSALGREELMVFAADTPTALYHLQKSGLKHRFNFKGDLPLYQSNWFAGVKKGDPELLEKVTAGFTAITDRERRNISRQWASGTKKEKPEGLIVAVSRGYAPFTFLGPDGEPTGLLVDLWRMWSKATKIPISFKAGSWAETISALRNGEADVHSGLFKNEERAEWLSFSTPLYESGTVLFYRSGVKSGLTLADLAGQRVGAMKGSFQEAYLRANHPRLEVVTAPEAESLILALLKGEVEAFIHEEPVVQSDLGRMGLAGLVTHGEPLFSNRISAGVPKDREDLLQRINQGLQKISLEDLAGLEARWRPNEADNFYKTFSAEAGLSPNEKVWIRSNPTITVAATPDWPPFEFRAGDKYQGLHADIIRLVADKVGLKVRPVFDKWSVLVDKLKKGQLDLCPGLNATKQRQEYLAFTDPVSESLQVIIAPPEAHVESVTDLKGRTVAVEKGYATESFLKKNYPGIKILEVKNTLAALRAVITGKARAYLGNQAVALYLIKKDTLTGLKVVAFVEEAKRSRYRIGVIRSKPVLRHILQKGLAAVTPEEMAALQKKWFGMVIKSKPPTPDLGLTDREKAWIEEHPVITAAGVADWAPFEFQDENGRMAGISADLARLAAKRAGLKIEFTFGQWDDLVGRIKQKKLDMLPGLVRTKERQEFILFTDSYFSSEDVIWTRDAEDEIRSEADLDGKTVVVEKGYSTHSRLEKSYPQIKLMVVETTLEALKALSQGHAEAYVGLPEVTAHQAEKHFINNLKIAGRFGSNPYRLRMGFRSDYPLLLSIIQKGLDSITRGQRKEIVAAYIDLASLANKAEPVGLTPAERAWLRAHPRLRLGVDPAYAPFEVMDPQTGYGGIASEYAGFITRQLDLVLNPLPNLSWQEVLAKAKARELDLLPCLAKTPEREKYLNFTEPYLSFPVVIFTSQDAALISGLESLKGLKVGVVGGYAAQEYLKADHPELKLEEFQTLQEALTALSTGALDALVNDMASASHAINRLNLANLKVGAMTDYNYDLAIGVRRDWPELIPILNKTLATVTPQMADEFKQKWLTVEFSVGLSMATILAWSLPVVGALGLIMLVIVWWNRRLGREISERKAAEEALLASQSRYMELVENANSIILKIDQDGVITFFNEYAQKFFGYPAEEAIGRNIGGTLIPETDSSGQDLRDLIQDIGRRPELYELNENENIKKDGSRVWVGWTNKAIYDDEGRVAEILCIGSDVTEQRRAQRERDEAFNVISSSINYATHIQRSILPRVEDVSGTFPEHFVLWEPRDKVGGDVYFCKQWGLGKMLALADGTGHGVPGAFLTLITSGALNLSLMETMPGDSAALMQRTHQMVQTELGQDKEGCGTDDGLEMGVCYYLPGSDRLVFAGARFSLFYTENGEVFEVKGDKKGMGYCGVPRDVVYTNKEVEIKPGRSFFMTSDGLIDQVGGPKKRGFGKKRFKKLLLELEAVPMADKGDRIYEALLDHQGEHKRRDDVSVLGFTFG